MNISKKVLATVTSLAVAVALVVGAVGSGANTDTTAKNDVTATNSVAEGSTGGIGVNTSTNTSTISVPDYADNTVTYEIPVLSNNADNADTIKKLIGVDYDAEGKEITYYLGTAALFTAFAEDTVTIVGAPLANPADTEGRIAAPTVLNEAGRSYTIKGNNSNGAASDGRAVIICENGTAQLIQIHPITAGEGVNSAIIASTSLKATDSDTATMLTAINNVIDFEAEFTSLRAKSAELAALQSNTGKLEIAYGTCKAYGYNPYINVFSFTEEQWNVDTIQQLEVYIPTGSYAIFNVAGETIDYFIMNTVSVHFFDDASNAGSATGTPVASANNSDSILAAKTHLLFNFYEATKFDTEYQIKGNILAPNAEIGGGSGHNYGQLIGSIVHIDVEQDSVGFTMPASYIDKADEEVVKYTAHYVYLGTDGKYYEINNDSFTAPTLMGLMDAYSDGTQLSVLGADAIGSPYNDSKYTLTWEVYEDGKDIYEGTEGDALLTMSTYEGFTSVGTVAPGANYVIDGSNVYFVAKLTTKVNVDVTFVDGGNTTGRPDDMSVTLNGVTGTPTATVDTTEVSDTTIRIDNSSQAAQKTTGVASFIELPAINADGTLIDYAAQLKSGELSIGYSVPDNYTAHVFGDSEKDTMVTTENGVATYHIVLKKVFDTRFFINGNEVTYSYVDGEDLLPGTTLTIPWIDNSVQGEDTQISVPNTNAYTIYWVDKTTGDLYTQGDGGYKTPARDVELHAVIMVNYANQIRPRFAYDLVTYNGKYEIVGKTLYSRIQYDEQTVYYIGCDEETVKNDTEGKYYYLTLMTGAPQDVKSILFNISEVGYDESLTFTHRFDTLAGSATSEVVQNFYRFGKNTAESAVESYLDLLAGDEYLDTYTGMVMYRFVLPVDYATKSLYFSTYYDYADPDTYWGRYEFVIADKWNVETVEANEAE